MSQKPNIVLIIVDNMAAEALGCYGNEDAYTPYLDRLSTQGIQFNNVYCANGLCSPTRASLLSGLMPSQHGIHNALPEEHEWFPEGWTALDEFQTLPQTLKDNGYKTALVGKYHLGTPYTPHHGFDHWVCFETGHTSNFWDTPVIENGKTYNYEDHATELWTEKAVEYIRDNAQSDQPFFLHLAYNAPYGSGPAIQGSAKNRFWRLFKDKPMNSIPREGVHPDEIELVFQWKSLAREDLDFSSFIRSQNNLPILRNFFSQISLVDEGVGRIMATLQQLGLEDDTLILFTADHGTSMGRNGIWGFAAYTIPANAHKQCFHIPMIVRHTNHIMPLQESDLMVMQTDWFATLLDYIGLNDIEIENSPGKSLAPLLKGTPLNDLFDAAFMEHEETRAIRTQKWLYVKRFAGSSYDFKDELYDLLDDPGEDDNIASDPAYTEVVKELSGRVDSFFSHHADPKYDLWNGGTLKAYYMPSVQGFVWKDAYGPDWKPEFPRDE